MGKLKLIGMALIALVAFNFVKEQFFGTKGLDVVDLNVVLDQFVDTASVEGEATETDITQDDALKVFVSNYSKSLNAAPLFADHTIGVELRSDGAFLGFLDEDKNNVKDGSDSDVFTVEVDEERDRIVATDLQNGYHRAEPSNRILGGLFTGYLIHRMLSGQRSSGINSSRFKNMSMSSRNYHAGAKSAVSSRRASARSSSGSGSFRSGK